MRIVLLILLLNLLPSGSAFAAPAGLYTGEVPVQSQQKSDRNRALPLALKQVLQKLSGRSSFDDYPLDLSLNRAQRINLITVLIAHYFSF